jgi:hypothetical protein
MGFVWKTSIRHQSMGNGRAAKEEKKNNTEIAQRDGHLDM